jgi:uncharacterized phage protein (TIGR02220 family)
MGVSDIRIKITFLDHPKILKLKKKLGFQGLESLMRLWFFAAEYHTSGYLDGMDKIDIAIACRWPEKKADKFIDTLVTLNLLELSDCIYYIHGWDEYNSWAVGFEKRAKRSKKANEKRWGSDDLKTDNKDILNEKNRTPIRTNTLEEQGVPPSFPFPSFPFPSFPFPSFPFPSSPFPSSPSPTKRKAGEPKETSVKKQYPWKDVLSFLNEKTGRKFRETDKYKTIISARFKEGYTLADFKSVVKIKTAEWQSSDMEQHLNPTTLFGTKMDKYLNQKKQPVSQYRILGSKEDIRRQWVNSIPHFIVDEDRTLLYDKPDFIKAYDIATKEKNEKDIERLKSILRHQKEWKGGNCTDGIKKEKSHEKATSASLESTKKLVSSLQNTPDDTKGLASLEKMASNLK